MIPSFPFAGSLPLSTIINIKARFIIQAVPHRRAVRAHLQAQLYARVRFAIQRTHVVGGMKCWAIPPEFVAVRDDLSGSARAGYEELMQNCGSPLECERPFLQNKRNERERGRRRCQ